MGLSSRHINTHTKSYSFITTHIAVFLGKCLIKYNIYNVSLDVRHGYIKGLKNYFRNNQTVHGNFRDVLGRTQAFISRGNQEGNEKEIDVMLDSSLP